MLAVGAALKWLPSSKMAARSQQGEKSNCKGNNESVPSSEGSLHSRQIYSRSFRSGPILFCFMCYALYYLYTLGFE